MKCDTPFYKRPNGYVDYLPLPCGKCPNCKRRRVSDWSVRLQEEDNVSLSSHFVTLTYNTDHVPISPNGFMTLNKRDFQLFMKRLRKSLPKNSPKIKYYCAGEYGEKTNRPHFHAIMFNVPDIELINDAWQLGTVHVGSVSEASVKYTAKYIDKDKRIPMFKNDDRIREFSLKSKGLGESYLTPEKVKYHKDDITRLFVILPDGIKAPLPRYYRDKIYTDSEKRQQLKYIHSSFLHEEKLDRMEFDELYGNIPEFTYENYLFTRKKGRYQSFYNSTNLRP